MPRPLMYVDKLKLRNYMRSNIFSPWLQQVLHSKFSNRPAKRAIFTVADFILGSAPCSQKTARPRPRSRCPYAAPFGYCHLPERSQCFITSILAAGGRRCLCSYSIQSVSVQALSVDVYNVEKIGGPAPECVGPASNRKKRISPQNAADCNDRWIQIIG